MKDAISKDKFISDEDAKLINKFLEKISSDLNKNSNTFNETHSVDTCLQ